MNNKTLISLAMLAALAGCASTQEKPVEEKTLANDFPTRDRVEYVLNCVAKHGGLNYINQYACGCKVDKIAEKMTFEDYEAAQTISYLRSMPGDGGGEFRDPAKSKDLRKRLTEAEKYAEKNCFVK